MALIEVSDVHKIYRTGAVEVCALCGVSLTVEEGEFVSIMGPSGSGKSTLMHILGCLDQVTRGRYLLDGIDVSTLDDDELAEVRNEKLGFVFQAYNLIPVLTARENVEFVMQIQGVAAATRRARSMAILEEVGLRGLHERRPAQLSGGQQQRVAVARAIVSRPALVLADEPTANLDSVTAEHLMDLFVELNQRHGSTFVIATHDSRVMAHARRLIRMQDGRIIEELAQR
jgi:putative ABC transport system ATP-binding protein